MMSDAAFVELYHSTYYALYRYVSSVTFDKNLIEDIIQETYNTAYMKRDVLEKHENPVGWLMLTARFKMQSMYKSESKHFNMKVGNEEYLLGESGDGEAEIRMIELKDAVEKELCPEEKELLFRYYLEGFTSEELTEQYNISKSCLKMRIKRIRERLRTCM